jgi:hypothetical protein
MPIEKYSALKNFDHFRFRRHRIVFVGDHEDAERCRELRKARITLYAPSQWHDRFPGGYIQFGWGRGWMGRKLFDIDRRTINGTPAYIFEDDRGIDLLYRRLNALNQLKIYARTLPSRDIAAYWDLVVKPFEPQPRPWGGEDYLRLQILQSLQTLGLADLESLVDAARPSTEAATSVGQAIAC